VTTPTAAPRVTGAEAAEDAAARPAAPFAWWAVFLAYALFSIYATWPTLPDLWRGFALGDDPSVSAWGLWWTKEAMVALDNPWYTRLQAAPEGVYLSFHALVPLAGFVLSPLTALFGPGVTLGLTKLFLPPVAALVAQRASLRVGLSFWPAVAAGGLYGFATLIVWKTTFHFNFGFGAPFLPLAVLWAARARASGRNRDWVGLGVVGGAAVLVDPFIAVLVAIVAATFLLATWSGYSHRGVARLALAAAVALLVASPQLWMTGKARSEDQYTVSREGLATSWLTYNASVDTLVSPGNLREFVPGTLELWATRHDGDGGGTAYGWGLLALALAGIVLTRRRPAALWWAIGLAALGSVLALGPEFTLSEDPAVPLAIERHGHELSAIMPYTWLVQLPVFEDFRVSARFSELAVLGLAVAAGFGIQALWSRRGALRIAAVALLVLAVLEAGWPDGGRNRVIVPFERTELYEPVRADRSDSTVIDLPYGLLGAGNAAWGSQMPGNEFMLRAPEHGHPIVGGWVTRLSARRVSVAVQHRLLVDLAVLQGRRPPPGAPFNVAPPPTTRVDARAGRIDADRLRVRWAVVWPTASPALLPYLRQLGFRAVRRDGAITLMRR